MSEKTVFERVVGILEDIADIAGLGARVAREAQTLTTPEAKEQLKAELGERVVSLDQARAVRKGKAVAAKDRVHG